MKFYRVSINGTEGHEGYWWFTSKREANQYVAKQMENEPEGIDITEVNILPTKDGILMALTNYASHANNG